MHQPDCGIVKDTSILKNKDEGILEDRKLHTYLGASLPFQVSDTADKSSQCPKSISFSKYQKHYIKAQITESGKETG